MLIPEDPACLLPGDPPGGRILRHIFMGRCQRDAQTAADLPHIGFVPVRLRSPKAMV